MKLQAVTLISVVIVAGATPLNVRQAANPSVTVDTGPLTGTTTTFASSTATVNKFLGIPFGSIPERFEPAVAAPTWTGTFDATSYKTFCVQEFASNAADPDQRSRTITVFNEPPTGPQGTEGEDCLNLNVFTPSTASSTNPKPVMFWIYGGALAFGASSLRMYDGSHFAADQDVIIVTINYRTNIFGFPGYPGQPTREQNLGFLDQRLALAWVQRNIRAFGGDPDRVTIFGESAGAQSVDALITLPPSPVPFVAAIMESGQASFAGAPPNNASKASWDALAQSLDRTPEAALPVIKDMEWQELRDRIEQQGLTFTAVKGDDVTWTATPRTNRQTGNIARVPILIGSNAREGSFYALPGADPNTELFITYYSFQCPARFVAEESKNSVAAIPSWRYYFNAFFPNNQPLPNLGAYHSSEIPEVFGTYNQDGATTRQKEVSSAMMKAWADFAKNPANGPGWAQVPTVEVFEGSTTLPVQYPIDQSTIDGTACASYLPTYNADFP